MLGVEYLIGVSACGSLQEKYAPGHIVIPDQLFDRTCQRALSFFDDPSVGTDGLIVHVGVAEPFCAFLNDICYRANPRRPAIQSIWAATLSPSKARVSAPKRKVRVFRSWGMDIIGMTTTPEAQLAREAEMSYSVMAHVTDYDVWHESEEPVTVEKVVRTLLHNAEVAKQAVANAIQLLTDAPPSPQANALRDAIITNRSIVRPAVVEKLKLIVGHYFV